MAPEMILQTCVEHATCKIRCMKYIFWTVLNCWVQNEECWKYYQHTPSKSCKYKTLLCIHGILLLEYNPKCTFLGRIWSIHRTLQHYYCMGYWIEKAHCVKSGNDCNLHDTALLLLTTSSIFNCQTVYPNLMSSCVGLCSLLLQFGMQ